MTKVQLELKQLIQALELDYPVELAEDWDQVGLHFGRQDAVVKNVMTTLDVRPEVVKEAISRGIDTIIVHHPILFSPIKRMDNSTPDLLMYTDIVKHDINIYAMHTNLDKAQDGMNDWLAEALNLKNIRELGKSEDGVTGLGRLGELEKPMARPELLTHIKNQLKSQQLTIIEQNKKESYQRLAIVGGASFDSLYDALREDVDVFITGDITFHKGQDAFEHDLMTIDAGHYIEQIFKEKMTDRIKKYVDENNWAIEVVQSETNTNPFRYE